MAIAVFILTCSTVAARAADAGAARAKDTCLDCHKVQEGTSIPFQNDIHFKRGLSCADCHGGDPNEDDPNLSMSASRGFLVRVTRAGMAEFCGRCHSNAAFMQKHNPKQRVDQVKLFTAGAHAAIPAGSDTIAATCVDCHSHHNTRAVADPQSTVAPERLARTCGKCHADSSDLFQKSTHGPLFVTTEMRACASCHASHQTTRVTNDMLAGGRDVCSKCHEPDSAGGKVAAAMGRTFENIRVGSFGPPPAQPGGARAAGAPPAGGPPAGGPPVPGGPGGGPGIAPGAPGAQGRGAGAGMGAPGAQGRGAGPGVGAPGAPGRAGVAGARGPRATDPRMRKALSLVHSLDVAAVKAALEAMQPK